MSETPLVREIMISLSAAGALVWRQQSGLFHPYRKPEATVRIGQVGQSDIGAIYRGYGIQVEAKFGRQSGNKARKKTEAAQGKWGAAVERAGGYYVKATCWGDVQCVLDAIDARIYSQATKL